MYSFFACFSGFRLEDDIAGNVAETEVIDGSLFVETKRGRKKAWVTVRMVSWRGSRVLYHTLNYFHMVGQLNPRANSVCASQTTLLNLFIQPNHRIEQRLPRARYEYTPYCYGFQPSYGARKETTTDPIQYRKPGVIQTSPNPTRKSLFIPSVPPPPNS